MKRFGKEPATQAALADLVAGESVAPRVVDAFRVIDRRAFVPRDGEANPYVDRPIGIPEQQTTSQPSLIARMVDALDVLPGDRVLEVGTGLGFQTALLAHLAGGVVSIERHQSISEAARDNLDEAGISDVELIVGDGWLGWPDGAPYDAIVVSAAAARVPDAFVDQLVEGGRLVIPLRAANGDDVLLYMRRNGHLVKIRLLTPARFVPLVPGPADDQSKE
jgi:protein-L-isoaspartate(D-aspartate) O-methyltransferase